MEKEKKKLLLVAVSSGVFLVIVFGAAILIFTPKVSSRQEAGLASSKPVPAGGGWIGEAAIPATVDASDMVRNTGSIKGIQTPPAGNESQDATFFIDNENPSGRNAVEKSGDESSPKVVINVPRPTTAAVPDVPVQAAPQPVNRPAPAAPSTAKAPAPAKPASAPKPAASAKPAAAKPAAAKPKTAAPASTRSDYWVQTGAFTAKVRAEGVKETLAGKGITSIIENREVDGKTWFRVRVGPYTSENEANYWLALVQSIDGFAGSQVRQTRSVR